MSPRHHPSAERLIDLAAGKASADRALVVDAHVRACRACAAEVAMAEAVAGAMLGALPAAPMEPDALALALARIERPAPPRPPARTGAARGNSSMDRPDGWPDGWIVAPHAAVEAAHRRRRWAAPGVWVASVTGGPFGRRSYLLRVAAGMSVPRHTHRGPELVCVLKGAYEDRGEIFGPGDFCESDEAVEHRPRVTAEGECVCLVAVDASLVARDWVGRLFQPIVRI
jgi:putative transcriptional regulator